MSEQKRKRAEKGGLFAVIAAILAFPSRVLALLGKTHLGRFFLGYGKTRELLSESRLASNMRTAVLEKRIKPFRLGFTNLIAKSRVTGWYRAAADMFRYTKTYIYGIVFCVIGIYAVLGYFIGTGAGEQSGLITGIALMLLSAPLLFSRKPLSMTVQENAILSRILYDVFEMRRATRARHGHTTINAFVGLAIGFVLGIPCLLFHPLFVIASIFALILFFLLLSSPEFCLFAAIFVAPFLIFVERPAFLLGVIVAIGTVSYFCKVLLGKRTFSFGPMDLAVAALALLYIGACPFTFGGRASVLRALSTVVLLFGYFLSVNLLSSRRILRHAITTLMTSGAIVAAVGLVQQIGGRAIADWLDHDAYDYIAGRITSVFENPNVLAVYLILILPFTAAGFLQRGRTRGQAFSFLCFLLCITAVVYTWSRGAWLGVILSLALFLFLCRPATVYLVLPVLLAFPILMTTPIGQRLSSITSLTDTSISYRLGIWQGALGMAGDHLLGGVGVGEAAFRAYYPLYALSGIEGATHAHNLLLQFLCEFGILGPILFVFLLVLFFQCALSHQASESDGELRLLSIAASCGIFAVLINGLFDYVFYNLRVFFLFFVVVGIAVALARVGKTERIRSTPIYDKGNTESVLDISLS